MSVGPVGIAAAFFALGIAGGCDIGGLPARPPDAAGTVRLNALGQVCSAQAPCPTSPPHQCVILSFGSQEQGYCSPTCLGDTDCATGYNGPASGSLSCFVPDQPQSCSISCTTTADCPTGLECLGSPGAPLQFCVVPAS